MHWNTRFAELKTLQRAWQSVRAADGGPGMDAQTVEQFGKQADRQLANIATLIASGRYRYSRLRVAKLPKPNGNLRTLGIPTVSDRVVLQSIRYTIEPACEPHLLDCSHAYRADRGTMTALAEIAAGLADGYRYVLESDIESFYDSIHHSSLLTALDRIDRELPREKLVREAITMSAGLWSARKGISQGSPLSPLLANVALMDFDRQMTESGFRLVRYADDFVVLCRSRAECEAARTAAEKLLSSIRLKLHPDKTRLIDNHQTCFTFLGFELHPDRIVPTAKNLAELRSGILAWCNPHEKISWGDRIDRINSLLRSFAWYYHQTDSRRLFWSLDAFVDEQLTQLAAMIGEDTSPWRERLVRMSDMREVSWRGKKGKKTRGWNGYGK